jgi:hypothetical protein
MEAETQMSAWSSRLSPSFFNLFGGEPCLNPDLVTMIELAYQYWPKAIRQVMSNGTLLKSVPGLGSSLMTTGTRMVVTRHTITDPIDYSTLQKFIERGANVTLLCADGNPPPEGFKGSVRTKKWTKRYDDVDGRPIPIQGGNVDEGWLHCPCRGFVQLRGGRLYKCPTVAYLPTVRTMLGDLDAGWDPVLAYKPLSPDCTDDELDAFLGEGGIPACAACSLNPLPMSVK